MSFWLLNLSTAWAQSAGATPARPSMLESIMPIIFVFVIIYFLMIRPQAKRNKQHGAFLTTLKRGDNVLTASGMFGVIEGLTDRFVTLEISQGVKIRILKSQIASPIEEDKK